MAQKNRTNLIIQAAEIRDETTAGANTATRVGTMDVDIVDSFLNITDDTALYDQSADVTAVQGDLDIHTADGTIHFTQGSISITESQISDLQSYLLNITAESIGDLSDVNISVPAVRHALMYDGVDSWDNRALVEADISDLGSYLTTISGSSHTQLDDVGTNTHAQIDTHIATVSGNPHAVKEEQLDGTRSTNATVTTTQALDWDAYKVFEYTLTGNTTITDSNLPTGTETRVIEMVVTGDFTLTFPAYYEALPSNDTYDGTKRNHIVISCINGTAASEDVIYSLETLTT